MLPPANVTQRQEGLFSNTFNDIYFSTENGLAETEHVFINGNNLTDRWQHHDGDFSIAETGFGTGLNFLATWRHWLRHSRPAMRLHYFSVEKHPLDSKQIRQALESYSTLQPLLERLLHHYPEAPPREAGFELFFQEENICFRLLFADVSEFGRILSRPIDAWYLDGFSPAQNPDMWGEPLFDLLAEHTKNTGTAATFTAAGIVKRGLRAHGFQVKRAAGFGHKRHMLTACRQATEKTTSFPGE